MFPESSDPTALPMYVPISELLPRPVMPKSDTPATSVINRTHRVQCIQRFITVFISGPQSLS